MKSTIGSLTIGGWVSTEAAITASIVHDSGVGPSECDISVSDLHPLNASQICERHLSYLGRSYVSYHQRRDRGCPHRWATKNNLRFNSIKSREMLIVRGGRWRVPILCPLEMELCGSNR